MPLHQKIFHCFFCCAVLAAGTVLYQLHWFNSTYTNVLIWLVGWFLFLLLLLLFRIWELLSACSSIQSLEKTISPRWTHLRQLQLVQIPRKPNLNTTLIFNVQRLAKIPKLDIWLEIRKRAGWAYFWKFCLSRFFFYIYWQSWIWGMSVWPQFFYILVFMLSHLLPLPPPLICYFLVFSFRSL